MRPCSSFHIRISSYLCLKNYEKFEILGLLTVVEAAKEKLESVISDLQVEVKALKNKVEFLEKERENLQSQSESQTQLQSSQVDALEAVYYPTYTHL